MAFLDRVIKEKRIELERKKAATPQSVLQDRAHGVPVRSFIEALRGGERIIAEVKKRSPRVEAFKQGSVPTRLAEVYENNGAAAISVVTDEANFGTSLVDVEQIREVVKLPVLVKDFVVDPYQVMEARASGADAILLIARILASEQLASLKQLADELRIDALVETHDEADIDKALAAGAEIIGINNRDLDSLQVSLDTTRRLVTKTRGKALTISESGINDRGQIEELTQLGVDAFLIGGSLLESEDPGELLATFLNRTRYASDSNDQKRTRRNA